MKPHLSVAKGRLFCYSRQKNGSTKLIPVGSQQKSLQKKLRYFLFLLCWKIRDNLIQVTQHLYINYCYFVMDSFITGEAIKF